MQEMQEGGLRGLSEKKISALVPLAARIHKRGTTKDETHTVGGKHESGAHLCLCRHIAFFAGAFNVLSNSLHNS